MAIVLPKDGAGLTADAVQAAIAAHPSADQMTRARAWALGREGAAAPPFKTQEAADAFALGRAARGSHP